MGAVGKYVVGGQGRRVSSWGALVEGTLDRTEGGMVPPLQGKFIRIHFGPTGKLASADIDSCESGRGQGRCGRRDRG